MASPAAAQPLELRLADLDRMHGMESGARLGRSMALGDLDCDGVDDDLVLAAENPASLWVWFDLMDPQDAWPSPSQPGPLSTTSADLRIDGVDDSFGIALAVGDLGGACDSIVVGAPDELLGEGTARVFHGPLPGDCAGPCLLQASVHEDFSVLGVELGRMGAAVAIVGDVDRVGHDDLVIGEPDWSGGDGRVLVFGEGLGSLGGGTVLSVLDAGLQILGANQIDSGAVGNALQAADVDGDGEAELLIAAATSIVLVHDLSSYVSYSPLSVPPVLDWSALTANVLVHYGHVRAATLPIAVHSLDQPRPALWVGTPWYFLGVGGVVGLLPDIQNRYDVSTADASVRLEGVALQDGNFGMWVDGSDVDGDGVQDLVVTSPLWTDGTGTVDDSVGPRAGRTFIYDGNAIGLLFDAVCAPPPCRVIGEDEALIELQGRQEYEGYPANPSTSEAYLGVRAIAAADRLLLAAPLRDDDVAGLEAGAVFGLTLDLDGDGVLLGIDCDDLDATVFPGAPPICDDAPDQDCDGVVDLDERDADLDGLSPCDGDCDDADPLRSPARDEVWCDGRDNDCVLDDLDVPELDADADGVRPCEGDCDDANAARGPDEPEACNGVDDDCDALIDEDFDADGDGYPDADLAACAGLPAERLDCDDADPWRNPGAAEGEGIDDADCDGAVEWRGGCACDARGDGGGLSWLLLPLLLARRRRSPSSAWLLLLVPALMGQARVLPATDDLLVLVGDSAVALPASMTVVRSGDGDHALVVGRPYAPYGFVGDHGWGYVYRPSQQLPRLIDDDDVMFFGTTTDIFSLRAGHALASGDIDGDGRQDLVATGPTGIETGGRVWTWLGKGDADCPDDAVERGGFCQGKGFRSTDTFNDNGWTVSVTDLDGDGFDDIVAGDPTNRAWNFLSLEHFGAVMIYWGQADHAPDAVTSAVKLPGTADRALGSFARAEADWDCDGAPDLVVGCDPTVTSGCATGAEQLQVLFNTPGQRPWAGALENHRPLVTITGLQPSWDMVVTQVPDVGGDGCDDVLLGLPATGSVAFLPIEPTSSWFSGTTDFAEWPLADLTGWELAGPADSEAGVALELVRWTDPTGPWPDLLIGMPGASSELGEYHQPGRVAFLRGDTAFAPGALVGQQDVVDVADVVFEGRQQDEQLGARLAVWADRDGDGLDDVLVGATGLDHPDGGLGAGGVYLLPSGPFSDFDGDGVPGLDDCDDRRPACIDADTDCIDADGDNVMVCSGDCDDSNPAIHPPRSPREWETDMERCDGADNDCDGALRADETDADGDGVLLCAGDCDDARAEAGPGFAELCNGLDDDCDGLVDEDFDGDGDGYPVGDLCAGLELDCNDRATSVHPGAFEVPGNGRDEDCDGEDPATWPGGCACSSSDPEPPGPLLMLLLSATAIVTRRRP